MRPPDLPSPEVLAAKKPHGCRVRYMGGCRCMLCRAANSRYECERAAARKNGEWNGLVPADRARRHLQRLSRGGVGRHSVSEACDVGATTLYEIKTGRKTQIRAGTESRILAVTPEAVAAGALVDAGPTWIRIRKLLTAGFTKAELARRLGYSVPAIQLRSARITARNAVRVERFYQQIMMI